MAISVPEQQFGEYRIRLMRDSEAPAVVDLYRAVYGDHFPIKEMYDPEFIVQQQEAGLMYRVVAVDAADKVLAHHAMFRLAETFPGLYEGGQGMVYPEQRGKGFSNVLQEYIGRPLAAAVGVEEFWGESVTNHVMMQKAALYVGVKESGIELEVMPAASYAAEKSAPGRVGAVVCYMVRKEKPQTVFLPAPYAELAKQIYAGGKRERTFVPPTGPLPAGTKSRYVDTFIAPAGLLRISLFDAGQDMAEVLAGLVKKHTAAGAEVLQVFLPLDKPWSEAATEVLNRQGFFFAALVPRWFDGDALLLQKLVHPTNYDEMKLHTDFAKEILQFIVKDRARVED
ncbi:MAG: hypothetical protein M0009_04215 [Deltaproteobacteria bacterium]|nr:hypothetical protein [Deltaproteobacteria bacterium]